MPLLLDHNLVFPDPSTAEIHGLVAVGGDLSSERLLLAYSSGIFPWFETDDHLLWWSPDPRSVIRPDKLHLSRSLQRTLRRQTFRVTVNRAFAEVVEACAEIPRGGSGGTWITTGMRNAYLELHRSGYAHSIECWVGDDLAGGLYGVAMGRHFFGESMFSRQTDASKVALAALCGLMRRRGGVLVDCQIPNPHLYRLGAVDLARTEFLAALNEDGLQATCMPPTSRVLRGEEVLDMGNINRLWLG